MNELAFYPFEGMYSDLDPRTRSEGEEVFRATIARATEAQRAAPAEQRAAYPWIVPPAFIAAEVERLTDSERAVILSWFAAGNVGGRFPFQEDYLRNTFRALIDAIDTLTPQTAADVLSIFATGRFVRTLGGLAKVLARMKRAGLATYAGHSAVAEAYARLCQTYQRLHQSRVEDGEIAARFRGLLGLSAPPRDASGADAKGEGPDDLSTDNNAIDDYVVALESLVADLVAWINQISAVDPNFYETAIDRWLSEAGSQGVPRRRNDAPLSCYARLTPPPPHWFLNALFERLDNVAEDRPCVACSANWFRGTIMSLRVNPNITIDRAWLRDFRRAAHRLAKSQYSHDWSQPAIVECGVLQLAGAPQPNVLFDLLWQARSAVPTKKWLRSAAKLLNSPEGAAAVAAARCWLEMVPMSGLPTPDVVRKGRFYEEYCRKVQLRISQFGSARNAAIADLCGENVFFTVYKPERLSVRADPAMLSEENDLVARGAVWLMSFDAANVDLLQKTAIALLAKVDDGERPNYRSLKGVNSCIWALGHIATAAAVVALGRIRIGVRDDRLSKQIAKAMADAAAQAGMTIDDLEDIAVPSYGLDRYATSTIDIAGHTATLAVDSTTDVAITIRRPDGTVAKGVPAAVKAEAEAKVALKVLQASAGEIARALPVQRLRLERSWLSGRSWTGAEFRERLLEHPLMSWLAARLVWIVTTATGQARSTLFLGGQPFDSEDHPRPQLADDDRVALWHPIAASSEEVRAWRAFVLRHRIVQPIKQTHREVYALTDAERHTGTYSNRFAGHILRQHQSAALARLRGWSCRLRVWADVPNNEPTHIKIPAYGLAAEYWTEGAGGEEPEVTDAQAYVFLRTDQIRFRRLTDSGDWRRDGGRHLSLGPYVALTEIGAVVFSEVMRDIDLLVGVASIGHDPTWIDAGSEAGHPDQWRRGAATQYWNEFNAAELAESAKTRHAFLADLVPKLAIAGRLHLDDRFLIVQGKLRSYRIHVGSGNIFMEPDNRYLCIVSKTTAAPKDGAIFLPFEGDRLLSLILSKAFLLTEDNAITDPAIVSQLR